MIQRISAFILFWLVTATLAHAQKTPWDYFDKMPWDYFEMYNDFSTKNLRMYDSSHIARSCGLYCSTYQPLEFAKEENGNQFVIIRSRAGQNARFNPQGKTIKDRSEIGTKNFFYSGEAARPFRLEGETVWYGFRVKTAEGLENFHAEEIMISQMKQMVEVNKWDCDIRNPFFKIKVRNNKSTHWQINKPDYAVSRGNSLPLDDEWSIFIVGFHFAEDGWLELFQDGKLITRYEGPTIYPARPKGCERNDGYDYVFRIGTYRGSDRTWVERVYGAESEYKKGFDELHFDDFIISQSQEKVFRILGLEVPQLIQPKKVETSPCWREHELKWYEKSGDTASLTIENKSASNVVLWRIADDATREQRGTLPSGDSILLETNVNRPWVLADGEGECQAIVIPKEDAVFEWAGRP